MYSQQLETLIQSVIADGVVTEKERAVLHKRAEAEGVDVDEIDVYVDGLINKMAPTKAVTDDDYNVLSFNRIRRNDAIYDIYRTPFCFDMDGKDDANDWNDGNVQVLLVYYKKNEQSEKQLYLVLKYTGAKDYFSFENLLFGLEYNSVLLVKEDIQLGFERFSNNSSSFKIDVTELQKICQSSNVCINAKYKYEYSYESFDTDESGRPLTKWQTCHDELKRSLPNFHIYLQEFYHNSIDNTAYTDVKSDVKKIQDKFIQEKKYKENKEKIGAFIEKTTGLDKGCLQTIGCLVLVIIFFIILLKLVWPY